MKDIITIISLPVLAGFVLFLVPEKFKTAKGVFALLVTLAAGFFSLRIFGTVTQSGTLVQVSNGTASSVPAIDLFNDSVRYAIFRIDNLGKLISLFISLFTVLITLYSLIYIKKIKITGYYSWFLLTMGCSFGAVLSDNLLLFLTFWGILGITLYKLIPGNNEESSATAKKTLILIGASDTIMIIGIALLWKLTGSLSMSSISMQTDNVLSVTAFIALLVGAFTKAGAFPFHSWVPDYTRDAPASSSAMLPASLDKLLGIYFLARLTSEIFTMGKWLTFIMLLIGGITIISAVMMALVQHNYKRLLGFHAVSQVGYMILGFGLGSAIGVAAGLFHMVNNALYKSGLFLSAGSIEYTTGKENIDDLGGLSKAMPVTFLASLIFAMSISGIPPFNGFASKWLIYQGIIDFGTGADLPNRLWVIWLGFAVLGSALTLASFIKLVGGIFLSRRKPEFENIREVPVLMWIPQAILALFCIAFGIFATNLIVPKLFMPVSGEFEITGFWNSTSVSLLVLVSIILGIVVYLVSDLRKFRTEDSFIGGEKIQDQTGYPTPEFYKTISEFGFFSWMYRKAEEKWFDIYDVSKQFVLWFSHQLSKGHTGVLPAYVIWVFAGLIIMLLIMT